jgi:3-polyprenyl-4-hydroxybenzoate decarboxylase
VFGGLRVRDRRTRQAGRAAPEGPFGDHYGYYSGRTTTRDRRRRAAPPPRSDPAAATVVGKPRQEDFFIGDYLQELLDPMITLVMPAVEQLWSYGETGYHSLPPRSSKQRYKREAMVSAFRILGEGQLSLTKFLLLTDRPVDLRDFAHASSHILARTQFETDLYVFNNLSMDTLDYTGPKVNEGSKGVLLGLGEPVRKLPREFVAGADRGTVCQGPGVLPRLPRRRRGAARRAGRLTAPARQHESMDDWPLVILVRRRRTVRAQLR